MREIKNCGKIKVYVVIGRATEDSSTTGDSQLQC